MFYQNKFRKNALAVLISVTECVRSDFQNMFLYFYVDFQEVE